MPTSSFHATYHRISNLTIRSKPTYHKSRSLIEKYEPTKLPQTLQLAILILMKKNTSSTCLKDTQITSNLTVGNWSHRWLLSMQCPIHLHKISGRSEHEQTFHVLLKLLQQTSFLNYCISKWFWINLQGMLCIDLNSDW